MSTHLWRMPMFVQTNSANVTVIDLRGAYPQVRIHESLWPFQTVIFQGQRYCLTRWVLLKCSTQPSIMKAVLAKVLSQDNTIQQAKSPYLDDIIMNEDVASAEQVERHLCQFGLECKPAERLASGARYWVWTCGGAREVALETWQLSR